MTETQANFVDTQSGVNAAAVSGDVQFESFKRLEAMIRAVPHADLVAMNIDGPLAVSVAFAAMPRIAELRNAMNGLGASLDARLVDETVAIGNAYLYANADYVTVSSPGESVTALAEEGVRLRDLMVSTQQVLEKHGLVKGAFIEGLKGPVGYRNLSHDLSALAQFYRDSWAVAAGKTPLTLDDVTRASVLAATLFAGAASRQGTPKEIAESSLLRQQAFSLFVKAYDETRRAVAFLRWREGDADEIAPSIYTARMARKKPDAPTSDAPVTPVTPTVPVVPVVPAAMSDGPTRVVPVGYPGSDPFGR